MRARKYNKRIEVWQTANVSDGFGGQSVTESKIGDSWAHITTLDRANRSTDEGITDAFNTIVVRTRKRNDLAYNMLNMFIKYRGLKYMIQQAPINVGYEDREIEFLAIRESIKEGNVVPPIGGNVFPYTFPFQLA